MSVDYCACKTCGKCFPLSTDHYRGYVVMDKEGGSNYWRYCDSNDCINPIDHWVPIVDCHILVRAELKKPEAKFIVEAIKMDGFVTGIAQIIVNLLPTLKHVRLKEISQDSMHTIELLAVRSVRMAWKEDAYAALMSSTMDPQEYEEKRPVRRLIWDQIPDTGEAMGNPQERLNGLYWYALEARYFNHHAWFMKKDYPTHKMTQEEAEKKIAEHERQIEEIKQKYKNKKKTRLNKWQDWIVVHEEKKKKDIKTTDDSKEEKKSTDTSSNNTRKRSNENQDDDDDDDDDEKPQPARQPKRAKTEDDDEKKEDVL